MDKPYDFEADMRRLLSELERRCERRPGVVIDLASERRRREARARKLQRLPQSAPSVREADSNE